MAELLEDPSLFLSDSVEMSAEMAEPDDPDGAQADGSFNPRRVWIAVIIQALRDVKNEHNTSLKQVEKDHTVAWFERRNEDFTFVCTMAGLEPDYVREKYAKAQRTGFAWDLADPVMRTRRQRRGKPQQASPDAIRLQAELNDPKKAAKILAKVQQRLASRDASKLLNPYAKLLARVKKRMALPYPPTKQARPAPQTGKGDAEHP